MQCRDEARGSERRLPAPRLCAQATPRTRCPPGPCGPCARSLRATCRAQKSCWGCAAASCLLCAIARMRTAPARLLRQQSQRSRWPAGRALPGAAAGFARSPITALASAAGRRPCVQAMGRAVAVLYNVSGGVDCYEWEALREGALQTGSAYMFQSCSE